MHFANSGFLWALSLLLIPIIIHLFRFKRYKQVYFPNIRFLQKIDEEQKARRRLKDILILITRLLALAFLVFAFSLPFLGNKNSSSLGNRVSIYIDNSFSMENESDQGRLLDIAKKKAEELVMTFQPSDQFQLISNDLETRHQRFVDRQAFLQFLYEIDLSASTVDLHAINQRQIALLEGEEGYDDWIAVLSDMQYSSADLSNFFIPENYKVLLLPVLPEDINNLYVDSLWFDDPVRQLGKSESLHFSIKNESDKNLDEVQVSLSINGQMKSMASVSIGARSVKDTLLHFTNSSESGVQNAILSVDDEPIVFDNDYYFSYQLKEKITVSEISGPNASNYNRLLFSDTLFTYSSTSVNQIDFQKLNEADLIILNELDNIPSGLRSFLSKWTKDGGHVFLIPGEAINASDYNEYLADYGASINAEADTNNRRVAHVELENTLFKDVFKRSPQGKALPQTNAHYRLNFADFNWETLFQLQGKNAFLTTRKVEDGRLYLIAIPNKESWSNWPRHALYITTMLRIAEESQRGDVLEHRIGDWSVITIQSEYNSNDRPHELRADDGSIAFIPSQQWIDGKLSLGIKDEVKTAGFYVLINGENSIHTLAFNYSRKESDLRFYQKEELELWAETHPNVSLIKVKNSPLKKSNIHDERPLWKYFIIAVLGFLLLEILIVKFFKQK
jgi:hypothetical protein